MNKKFNKLHLVTLSPWPILSSMQTQAMFCSMTMMFSKKYTPTNTIIYFSTNLLIPIVWWINTIKEVNKEGSHSKKTNTMIKMSMIMFIMSEIMFFLAFFWGYFHSSLNPSMEVGLTWPPKKLNPFNPTNVPLLNTIILISSGMSITWSHHLTLENKMKMAKNTLMVTWMMGIYFSTLQWMEYKQAEFSLMDSSYGTSFFMATGFHGFHVLVGTTFLIVNYFLMKKSTTTKNNHKGFEMSIWYWHFVDVVWLFLYLSIYWWGK